MLGGDIIKMKDGHPTKGTYWFPAYNSTEGVRALEFIKEQVRVAGINPQKLHFWGIEFLDKKFAVMLEALQHHINEKFPITSPKKRIEFEQKVGFMPMFPVPDSSYHSATLMGGWELSIPKTSTQKDLTYLAAHSNLPTQIPIGEGPYAASLNQTTPYYYYAQNRPRQAQYTRVSSDS
jgi:multiple sugar transport system substrate-binding protein